MRTYRVQSARLNTFGGSNLYTPTKRARGLIVAVERAGAGRRAGGCAGRGEGAIGCGDCHLYRMGLPAWKTS